MVKRTAFLGGSFDPPHNGHIQLARRARHQLLVKKVRVIPNGLPPHRALPQAPWTARISLCELALKNIVNVVVGRDEPPGNRPHWTVSTLQRLQQREKCTPLLIVGADSFAHFDRWRCWRHILRLTNVAVAARHGAASPKAVVRAHMRIITRPQQLANSCGRVFFWRARTPTVSSSHIRQRLQKKQSVTHMLPLLVLKEIQQHNWYAR